jgi:hypothetical protein
MQVSCLSETASQAGLGRRGLFTSGRPSVDWEHRSRAAGRSQIAFARTSSQSETATARRPRAPAVDVRQFITDRRRFNIRFCRSPTIDISASVATGGT